MTWWRWRLSRVCFQSDPYLWRRSRPRIGKSLWVEKSKLRDALNVNFSPLGAKYGANPNYVTGANAGDQFDSNFGCVDKSVDAGQLHSRYVDWVFVWFLVEIRNNKGNNRLINEDIWEWEANSISRLRTLSIITLSFMLINGHFERFSVSEFLHNSFQNPSWCSYGRRRPNGECR